MPGGLLFSETQVAQIPVAGQPCRTDDVAGGLT